MAEGAADPGLIALVVAAAYLMGAVPFGLLLARMAGLGDIRKIGSGNIGATNVLRTGNKPLALATLLLDGGKGAAAVLLARLLLPEYAAAAGVAAVAGHVFPIWLGFRGGKGVATTLGTLIALAWPAGLGACALWLAVAFATRYSSLAALVSTTLAPLIAWFVAPLPVTVAAAALALLIWVRHIDNIRRLLTGDESRIARSGSAPGGEAGQKSAGESGNDGAGDAEGR